MKIFIFTWDRYDTIRTPRFFDTENINYSLLVHSEEQAAKFIQHNLINPNNIIVTNKPKGLAYNRNFALDCMQMDEWALFFVDDLISIKELINYDTQPTEDLGITIANAPLYSKHFKKQINATTFLSRCKESINKAEEDNLKLVGFAGFTNHLFLTKKWKYNSVADGRCWLVKKTSLRFDENVQLIDDVCFTALNMKHFNGVLINQWIIPDCERYTAGAFGSIEQRLPQKISECKYLVDTYPEFIKYADKKGWPTGSHVTIKNISMDKLEYKNKQQTFF